MALANNYSVAPIKPLAPMPGGSAGVPTYVFPAVDTAILTGDILLLSSGKVARAGAAPDGNTVLGVANHASIAADQHILVHPALSSALFEGNIVGASGTTDLASGTYATHIGSRTSTLIATDPTPDVMCLLTPAAGTGATNYVLTHRWGRQLVTPDIYGPFDATIAVVNPRVVFSFIFSYWGLATP